MVRCTSITEHLRVPYSVGTKGPGTGRGKERRTLESLEDIGNLGGQPGARIPFKLLDTQVGGSTVSHDYVNFS